MVGLQASAVIESYPKGTEERILVQYGEEFGVDHYTSDGSTEGTDIYNEKKQLLLLFCKEHDLVVMSGVLDF